MASRCSPISARSVTYPSRVKFMLAPDAITTTAPGGQRTLLRRALQPRQRDRAEGSRTVRVSSKTSLIAAQISVGRDGQRVGIAPAELERVARRPGVPPHRRRTGRRGRMTTNFPAASDASSRRSRRARRRRCGPVRLLHDRRQTRGESTAADRHVKMLPRSRGAWRRIFEADRALPGDHVEVVERRHDGHAVSQRRRAAQCSAAAA